ncbi:MAG: NAD(P)/FAD-dependent oxidoreductase [Rhodospirillales bacterium]
MSRLSRRTFLTGLAATATFPIAARALPSDPDVVVIGAGSAGLAAARSLMAQGKSVVVVEAANRMGGRAFTETETFGIPFDRGCSWITGPRNTAYVKMAKDWGYNLLDHRSPGEALFVGDRRANAQERKKINRAYAGVEIALGKAGQAGLDVPASSVIPADLEYASIPQTWTGPMDWGFDFTEISTKDYWQYGDVESNYLVKEGFGTLVSAMGSGLPVRLNAAAKRVDWSGQGVSVETDVGTLKAKACIVTVSTGVLGAGKIAFTPALPDWKLEAIANVPMGNFTKIALQFDGERFGLSPNAFLTYAVGDKLPAEACYFLTFPFNFNQMIGFVGGAFGAALVAQGQKAAIDFALGELVKLVGSRARTHFVKGYMTEWASDPWTLGSYAAAKPGHFDARAALGRPLGNRVFFAGEAVAVPFVALCSGAYMSGEKAAKAVTAAIG